MRSGSSSSDRPRERTNIAESVEEKKVEIRFGVVKEAPDAPTIFVNGERRVGFASLSVGDTDYLGVLTNPEGEARSVR